MSNRKCNHCRMKMIEGSVPDGYTITKRHGADPRFPDGVEVWVHPEGIVIPVDADGDSPGWRHYFKTFFLELPDSCAC